MAFIDLPQELSGFTARRADGRISRFEFRVFAGEVVSAQGAASGDGKRRGAPLKLLLRSRSAERRFNFRGLPPMFETGDAAAVIAVFSTADKNGPIIGLGNLDAGERVDFRWREREILRLLSGAETDYRSAGARRRATCVSVLKGLALGLAGFVMLRLMAAGFGLEPTLAETLLQGPAASVRHSILASGAIAMLSAVYFAIGAARKVARKADGQERALRRFWERVGDALGYVADHRDRYRPRGAEPALAPPAAPPRLLPPPLEREEARSEAFEPRLAERGAPAAAAKAATIGEAVRMLESAARRRRGEAEFDPYFATRERRVQTIRRRAEEKWRESQRRRRMDGLGPEPDFEASRFPEPYGEEPRIDAPQGLNPAYETDRYAEERADERSDAAPRRRRRRAEPSAEPAPRGDGDGGEAPSFFEPGFSLDRGRLPGRSGRRFN